MIDRYLEHPATGGDEGQGFDIGLAGLEQFVRQTDGALGVVSNRAVFDGDVEHDGLREPRGFTVEEYSTFRESPLI